MKQGIVIIAAVAIIGILGLAAKSQHQDAAPLAAPSSAGSGSVQSATTSRVSYEDGTYTGDTLDSPYGTIQIGAVISGGKITDIRFLQMPNDRGHTQEVTAFSEPLLKQDTLKKQSAHIDFVSGATTTSEVYEQSLQSALDKAATG